MVLEYRIVRSVPILTYGFGPTWLNSVSVNDRWGAVKGMVGIDLGYIAVLCNIVRVLHNIGKTLRIGITTAQ